MNVILRAGRAVGATLALTIGLSACAAVAQGVDQGAHQNLGQAVELDVWFEQRFEDGVARSPQFQTSLGRTTNMDQWDDRSDAFAIEGYEISLRDLWDMRAHFDVAALERDLSRQAKLLRRASGLVKVGGRLIYATCSVLVEENEQQIGRASCRERV